MAQQIFAAEPLLTIILQPEQDCSILRANRAGLELDDEAKHHNPHDDPAR